MATGGNADLSQSNISALHYEKQTPKDFYIIASPWAFRACNVTECVFTSESGKILSTVIQWREKKSWFGLNFSMRKIILKKAEKNINTSSIYSSFSNVLYLIEFL